MKKVLIGCGGSCLGVLILAAIVAAIYGPKIFNWSKEFVEVQLENELTRQKLANQWTPPADKSDTDAWFPKTLETFQRESIEDETSLQHFSNGRTSQSAAYVGENRSATVFWLPANEFDFNQIVAEVREASEEGNSKSWMQMGFRAYISWNSPQNQYNIWQLKDWILVVHSTDADFDTDAFIQQLLFTFDAKQSPAAPNEPHEAAEDPVQQANPVDEE